MSLRKPTLFQGVATALITPFRDGMLDRAALCRLIEGQIEGGAAAILVAGTTGEGSTLSFAEHGEVIEAARDCIRNRVPLLAGCGSNCTDRAVELAKIAAYLHDIGNLVNRSEHSQSGAIMAWSILNDMGCAPSEIATIVTAIGNHDEGTGVPVNAVAAAMILADKADVRRSRVRSRDTTSFDIHDRVNYSVTKSELKINEDKTEVHLKLTIDTTYSSVMEYFEIFLERMLLCCKAAEKLGMKFRLVINDQPLL